MSSEKSRIDKLVKLAEEIEKKIAETLKPSEK